MARQHNSGTGAGSGELGDRLTIARVRQACGAALRQAFEAGWQRALRRFSLGANNLFACTCLILRQGTRIQHVTRQLPPPKKNSFCLRWLWVANCQASWAILVPPEAGRQAGCSQRDNPGPRDGILYQTASRLPVANRVFLGFWTVDIRQEGCSQRSAPQRRHTAHLRLQRLGQGTETVKESLGITVFISG